MQTGHLSTLEVGSYVRLLCWSWANGPIPNSAERLCLIAGTEVCGEVINLFVIGADGCLTSDWLEERRKQQDSYRLSRSQNRKGSHAKHVSDICASHDGHMEEEDRRLKKKTEEEGGKEKTEKVRRFTPPTVEQVEAVFQKLELPKTEASRFLDYYESKGWVVGKSPMKSWEAACRTWKGNWEVRNGNGSPKSETQQEYMDRVVREAL